MQKIDNYINCTAFIFLIIGIFFFFMPEDSTVFSVFVNSIIFNNIF